VIVAFSLIGHSQGQYVKRKRLSLHEPPRMCRYQISVMPKLMLDAIEKPEQGHSGRAVVGESRGGCFCRHWVVCRARGARQEDDVHEYRDRVRMGHDIGSIIPLVVGADQEHRWVFR
jgi:hypothetical protein